METTSSRYNWLNLVALLMVFPAAYLVGISVLKYGLNINGPFDSSEPLLERMGIKESPGWNINLLILFGPILAFLLTVLQVLSIQWHINKERLQFNFTIHKKWFPIIVALFSLGILATLFIYLLAENYR